MNLNKLKLSSKVESYKNIKMIVTKDEFKNKYVQKNYILHYSVIHRFFWF